MRKTYYYHSFDEDIIKNTGQDHKLPTDYKWINDGKLHGVVFDVLYAFVRNIARIYSHLFMHVRFVGREKLKECGDKGCFIYANHTQIFGDVVIPTIASVRRRVAVVVSPANLGIPVIGKLLPGLGAVPIPDDRRRMNEFVDTLKTLIDRGYSIFIYPEAHVWPYYTDIRPFSTSSFHYPVMMDVPVYCMTMTYQKGRNGRPKATCYIDKCAINDMDGMNDRMKIKDLHNAVYSIMKERSLESNYRYCEYIKIEEEEDR